MEGYSSCVYTALDEMPDIVPPPLEYDPPEEWTDFVNERNILEEEFKMLSTELPLIPAIEMFDISPYLLDDRVRRPSSPTDDSTVSPAPANVELPLIAERIRAARSSLL